MLVVVLVLLSVWATDLAPTWSWIRWVAGCTDCGQRLTHDVFFSASLFGRRERLLVSSGTWTSVEEMGSPDTLPEESPTLGAIMLPPALEVLSGPVSFCRSMPLLRRNDSHKSRFVPFLGAFFRRRRSPSRSPAHFYQSQALKRAAVSFFGERSEMTRTFLNVKTNLTFLGRCRLAKPERKRCPVTRVRTSNSSPCPSASSGFTAGRQLESMNFFSPMKNRRKK
jgi:hypothetical protein